MARRTTTTTTSPSPAPVSSMSYVVWQPNTNYKIPTIVLYQPNGLYYNLKQVDATGTSSGTDPAISSWYWAITTVSSQAPAPTAVPSFVDTFSTLDTTKWLISNWGAPGTSSTNKGSFAPANVFIKDNMLCLKLSQIKNADGTFTSVGGEISTKASFGYGTYEYDMRASSTASSPTGIGSSISGSITGLFSYAANSETEIDIEMEGNFRFPIAQFTTWKFASNPNEHTEYTPSIIPCDNFHLYKYVWTPTDITYFVDGVQVSKHTKVVPSLACPVLINHWGTNEPTWGGIATPDVDRYMWIKRFAFTPL